MAVQHALTVGTLLALGVLASALPARVRAADALVIRPDVAPEPLVLSADLDDDDEDGVLDAEESREPPEDDLYAVELEGAPARYEIHVEGALALWADGVRVSGVVRVTDGKPRLFVQALEASKRPGDAHLVVQTAAGEPLRVPVTIAALRFLDADNRPLDARRASLGVSRAVTHDRSLPRSQAFDVVSSDRENVRIELELAGLDGGVAYARLEAHASSGGVARVLRHVPLVQGPEAGRFRSAFLRLVSDSTDASAPDVGGQLLRVALRERVRAVVPRGDRELRTDLRVGRPGRERGERSVLRGRLVTSVLRLRKGGVPVLGDDEQEAIELAREQIEIANEIWAQCFVEFGDPAQAVVRVVDPPPPALLAIADVDGLPARGDGAITFRAGGKLVGPVATRSGASPEQTALDVARALTAAGFVATVTVNPRTEVGAGPSADIVVRDARRAPVALTEEPGASLGTDSRQRVAIGHVDLSDGIDEFDNALAATGTLEERTLVKLVADDDPASIDVILVNRFVNPDRQGEAFIEADGSATPNVLVFDRNAVRYERQAWVQAHELGHVLLDEALHPDNVGPDRPWLLMDADARQGRVTGPKRLSDAECKRARRRSGPDAFPALLLPAD